MMYLDFDIPFTICLKVCFVTCRCRIIDVEVNALMHHLMPIDTKSYKVI